jgi:hypothetical protein
MGGCYRRCVTEGEGGFLELGPVNLSKPVIQAVSKVDRGVALITNLSYETNSKPR